MDELLRFRTQSMSNYLDYVKGIIEYVRSYGDRGLIELTAKFDGVSLKDVVVSYDELKSIADLLPEDVRNSIDLIYNHLTSFNEYFKPRDDFVIYKDLRLGIMWRPLGSVGIYVPRGFKTYPSTLLMAGVPAKVAGVSRIYVASPPKKDYIVDPAIAYLAIKLGVYKVYCVGGPQIIAAMAYGTESVDKVDKVVGPGNVYVQVAKYLLQGIVAVDGVEGPTELVVLADDSADPDEVVLDMRAQAEHGRSSTIVLISSSDKLVNIVEDRLSSDEHTYFIIKVKDVEEGIKLVNELAPEHLSLHTSSNYELLSMASNVGAVSLKTPSAIIDYLGPNHILPTNGLARFRGALTVYDFMKTVVVAEGRPEKELLDAATSLARYEGFKLHSDSMGVFYGRT